MVTTVNISMPDSMKAYVDRRIAEDEFTTSEYVRHLIRKDQNEWELRKRSEIAQYLALCEQEMAEGKYVEWDPVAFRKETEALYKKRKHAKRKRA